MNTCAEVGTDTVASPFHTLAGLANSAMTTIDVQSLVQDWVNGTANNGILLTGVSGSDGLELHSDMSMMGPSLTVDYTAVPEPAAFLMLGLVGAGFGGCRWWKSRKAAK